MLVAVIGGPLWAGEIRLKSEAQCAAPAVRLGDIAEVEGEVTADGPSLVDLVLFPAPAAGKSRLVSRQEMRQLLSLCDVDVRTWRFTGAQAVEIHSGGPARSIIRPALHLIPTASHVRPDSRKSSRTAGDSESENPPLVRRGGSVMVHALATGVRITTSGKSLADAAQGENVLVELADSKEKILAKVVGPQLVEVRAGGTPMTSDQ
jgi:hypothetical protein